MPKNKPKTEFNQAEAAYLIRVSPRWMRDHPDVTLPARAANGKYDLAKLIRAIRQWERERPAKGAERSSPALEKWRRERARLAELDRMEREAELVPLVDIQWFHDRQAELLRRTIERLEKRYGLDAAQLVIDVIDDLERLADDRWGNTKQSKENHHATTE